MWWGGEGGGKQLPPASVYVVLGRLQDDVGPDPGERGKDVGEVHGFPLAVGEDIGDPMASRRGSSFHSLTVLPLFRGIANGPLIVTHWRSYAASAMLVPRATTFGWPSIWPLFALTYL